jgi:hypothetical protein
LNLGDVLTVKGAHDKYGLCHDHDKKGKNENPVLERGYKNAEAGEEFMLIDTAFPAAS